MDCKQILTELIRQFINFQSLSNGSCLYDVVFLQLLTEVENLQKSVDHFIKSWKREQQKSIISGVIDKTILITIKECNDYLLRIYVAILNRQTNNAAEIEIQNKIHIQMYSLLVNGFLIIEQPYSCILKCDPLTIISNARFEVKLCLLFDKDLIGHYHFLPSLNVRLLTGDEILLFQSDGLEELIKRKPLFEIVNKEEPKLNMGNNGISTISIVGNLKVEYNRRGHNPKAIPVSEEKFKFLFWLILPAIGRQFILYTFSLPVNVLSRKDYRNCYAAILWDNAFALDNRKLFETRTAVSWEELSTVLNKKFFKDVGKYLKKEDLDLIYTMIPDRNNTDLITWNQFAKIPLQGKEFTFFEWFYKTLVLIREQLFDLYHDGHIHGFISAKTSENILQGSVDGTFLIRFCQSFCGAVSISVIINRKFVKVVPWDLNVLKKRQLSRIIQETASLLYLYPHVPKSEVFPKYINQEITKTNLNDYTKII